MEYLIIERKFACNNILGENIQEVYLNEPVIEIVPSPYDPIQLNILFICTVLKLESFLFVSGFLCVPEDIFDSL